MRRARLVVPGPGQAVVAELVVTPSVDLLADMLGQSLSQQVLGGVLGWPGRWQVSEGPGGPTEKRVPWEALPSVCRSSPGYPQTRPILQVL